MADLSVNKSDQIILRDYGGDNLCPNYGFENSPAFTAATTTANRWIDGTAAGSTTNDIYSWALLTVIGTISTQFDNSTSNSGTNSIKLSCAAGASAVVVGLPRSGTNTLPDNIARRGIYALPSTSYTFTYWLRTSVTSGTSRGAFLRIQELNSSNTSIATHDGTYISTTTGWTKYSVTFTTLSTVAWLDIQPSVQSNVAPSTLIIDAWFDDITLAPTSRTYGTDLEINPSVTPGKQDISGPKIWS
jgi:hypothetical protein